MYRFARLTIWAGRLMFVAAFLCLTVVAVVAFSSGPGPGLTGAPSEGLCTACHSTFPPNSGPGVLTLGVPTNYELNHVYPITVTLEQSGQARWGFQITALTSSNTMAGTFIITDPTNTQSQLSAGRLYVNHTSLGTFAGMADGPVQWSVNWQAPSTNVGPVTFYAAGNAADNDGTHGGDYIYSTLEVVDPPPVPTITVVASLVPFTSVAGSPSAEQSYTVEGTDLSDDITITPPADFELSLTSGSGFDVIPIVLSESGGSVATTTIYVRMNSATAGPKSGNIEHTSTDAAQVDVPVSGTVNPVGPSPKFLALDPDSIFNEDPAKPGKSMKPAKRGKGLMPNWSNLLAETVLQGGFAPGASESDDAGGMVIGVSHMEEVAPDKWKPIKDSAAVRAWVRLSKWNFKKEVGTGWAALQKTLRNKEFNHYDSDPTATARGFDSTGYPGLAGRKPMKKQLSKLDPKKTPNKLFAELVALKFNIAASQMEKTPAGFGDLIYVNPSSGFDGMSVMDISAAANQMMTYWQGVDQADYDDLYSVVYAINRAFLGPIDTVSFEDGGKLVLNGAVDINAVPFLELPPGPRPFVATTLTPRNSYVEGFEDDFADEEWDEMEGVPIAAKLYQNYPNPFNPSTTISFKLRNDSYVTLKIFNVLGQEVMTLLNGEELEEGYQTVEFRADRLASGVYFYHLHVEDVEGELDRTVVTKKMAFLK